MELDSCKTPQDSRGPCEGRKLEENWLTNCPDIGNVQGLANWKKKHEFIKIDPKRRLDDQQIKHQIRLKLLYKIFWAI